MPAGSKWHRLSAALLSVGCLPTAVPRNPPYQFSRGGRPAGTVEGAETLICAAPGRFALSRCCQRLTPRLAGGRDHPGGRSFLCFARIPAGRAPTEYLADLVATVEKCRTACVVSLRVGPREAYPGRVWLYRSFCWLGEVTAASPAPSHCNQERAAARPGVRTQELILPLPQMPMPALPTSQIPMLAGIPACMPGSGVIVRGTHKPTSFQPGALWQEPNFSPLGYVC